MTDLPFVAFSNDELKGEPECHEGDMVECPHCHHQHPVTMVRGVDSETGKLGKCSLGFYKCQGQSYLASVAGRFVTGLFPRKKEAP